MFDGLMNNLCSLWVEAETQSTGGEVSKTWTLVASGIRCRLDMKRGMEVNTGGGRMVKASHILYMRWRTMDERKHRVKIGNDNYNILLVSSGGGTKNHLEILLERIH
jgi:head-tail adaptor